MAGYLDRGELPLVDDAPLVQRHVHAVSPPRGAVQKLSGDCLRLVRADVPVTLQDADTV